MMDLRSGNSLSLIRYEEDKSVDSVISDVPYGVNLEYWDSDMPPQSFLEECLRISRGPVVWIGGAKRILDFANYHPRPDRILIWAPKFTLGKIAQNGFAYRFHPIAVWRIQDQKVIPWDILDDATEKGNWWEHPATKPESLMRKLVDALGGQLVCDPFMGSGTTAVSCVRLGKDFLGWEIDEHYLDIAQRRVAIASSQSRLQLPLKDTP